jgi:hypothetical protein
MAQSAAALTCPDCDEPLTFAYRDTSGVGAHKRGDQFNTTPDTDHYLCFDCPKAWKQRLGGPLTPDVVGDLAFFTCRRAECGRRLDVASRTASGAGTELLCEGGHRYVVRQAEGGELMVGDR